MNQDSKKDLSGSEGGREDGLRPLIANEVPLEGVSFNPYWGHGCLGYDEEECEFFFSPHEIPEMYRVSYDEIFAFHDSWTGYTWVLFKTTEDNHLEPFVLHPEPDIVPRAAHPKLRELLS